MSVNAIRFIEACDPSVMCIELLLRPVMERFTLFRWDLEGKIFHAFSITP
jgi:hypothetical protein